MKTIRQKLNISKMTQTDGNIYHVLGLEKSILSKGIYYPRKSRDECNPYQSINGIFHIVRTKKS